MFGFIESIKEINGGYMNDLKNEELFENGIRLLEQSLEHFLGIENNDRSISIINGINGLITLAKTVYEISKK